MKKYLDNPRASMGWLALFSGILALSALSKITEVIVEMLNSTNDSFLIVNGVFMVLIYGWILYFLVVLGLAAFQKWRGAKV